MTKTSLALLLTAAVLSNPAIADDRNDILVTIDKLTTGVDRQDGEILRQAFHDDAAIFATNPAGDDLVSISADTFAKLHAEKRFGGQERQVSVDNVDVSDGLTANAKVVAENASVHYTYYLGLAKLDGEWRIQTFLQRSRPAKN